jgi:hypothetical protein
LFDRGVLTLNGVMDLFNMAHVENGDQRYIRREYVEVDKLDVDTKQYKELEEEIEEDLEEDSN